MKKVLCLLLIILLLSSIFLFYFENASNASYSSKFANYPGYEELLADLQKEHPNWEFEIYETGLEWSDVLKAETVARHGRSLIQKNDGVWSCKTCGSKQYEAGWYCASTAAVAYYLDPRNSLCEDYIFQFEQLTYDSSIQTKEGVEKILADCNYMQGNIIYYDTTGAKKTINKTYIDVIMEAAKTYNISPYHIASRIRQEMGTGSGSAMISGTYGSYTGYYNYFNWGAYGSDIMGSGLKTAQNYKWTDPEKAIKGGAQLLAQNYISCGQDTLYLQKFDVVDGGDGYYGHQYMTNVSASKTEGLSVKNAYQTIGMISKDSKIKFKIPVYKNMPTAKAGEPGKETIVTQDVQVSNEVNIRKGKGTDSEIITTIAKGTKLLRIELADKKENGYYWDKVVLSDGTKGYAIRNNLTQISVQSNCSEKYLVLNSVALRNGPGTENTDIVSYISEGQIITVIEKEKYPNLDEENWYRVKLTNGNCGYVAIGDSSAPNIVLYDENSSEYGYVKVICTDGLRIRTSPATNGNNIVTTVTEGTQLFRLQKNASDNEGYVWDKVVTDSGIVGYVVRQDKATGEAWIQSIYTNYTVDDKDLNITCIPNLTVDKLKSLSSNIVVKNGDTIIENDAKIGTGYTITVDDKTYTAVVMGDVTGTGTVTTVDAARVLKNAAGKYTLKDAYLLAADVTGDGKVTTVDAARVLKAAAGKYNLTVQ